MIDPNNVEESAKEGKELLDNDTIAITEVEVSSDLKSEVSETDVEIEETDPLQTLFMPSSELMRKIINTVRVFDLATKEELFSRYGIECDKSKIKLKDD